MEKTRIVVGADGSASSVAAVRWAAAEAERRGVELRILTAYPRTPVSGQDEPAAVVHDAASHARDAAPGVAMTTMGMHGYAVPLLLHAAVNIQGVRFVGRLNDISVWWHVFGVAVIVGTLAIVPDQHQSADFVFTEFVNNTGWSSTFYVALLGLLLAQYTLTGYDASAHVATCGRPTRWPWWLTATPRLSRP